MKKIANFGLILVLAMILFVSPLFQLQVAEAGLTAVSATLSRLAVGATANHTINFNLNTAVTAGQTIVVTWPSGFTLGTLAFGDIAFTGATLVGACNGVANEVTVVIAGQTATFTVCAGDTVTTGAKSIVFGNTKITNPVTPGSYTITITGTMANSGSAAVQILSNDQVAVTAAVDATLSFSISDNSIGFGTLSASAARFADGTASGSVSEVEAHNLIAATNAAGGYTITVSGTTLTSGGNTITAIGGTNTLPAVGTEQYGIRMTAGGGTGTVSALYAAAGFALDTAAFPDDEVASATGPSAATTYSVRYLANIAAVTEAGSYTSTLTYLATGRF